MGREERGILATEAEGFDGQIAVGSWRHWQLAVGSWQLVGFRIPYVPTQEYVLLKYLCYGLENTLELGEELQGEMWGNRC